ncbi:hypothetical protein [Qipengyuania sp.]|uniref:PAS domain-containing protein n=1 Tax=Qipengyuania sp. TaxID=2004515 RepID=UPI0035C80753
MDRFGGTFGTHGDAQPFDFEFPEGFEEDFDTGDDDTSDDSALSPVGQDERRMQVRAYNHWAAMLGEADFPDIAQLNPESLADFGPHGVLLHFDDGIEDPQVSFIGEALAHECGTDASLKRLSDVPSRSLLSRITDHYMQILANRAPIGFEAEFQNAAGQDVLYRGILLPWSNDGETINYIFGVINWKELADAATAEAILSEIDAALEAPIPAYEGKDMDRMLDLSQFATDDGNDDETAELPTPSFGGANPASKTRLFEDRAPLELTPEFAEEGFAEEDELDEDSGYETTEWGAGFSGFGGDEKTIYAVDYGAQGLEDGEEEEDDYNGVIDPLGDDSVGMGLSSLVSRGERTKASVKLPDPQEPAQGERTTLEQRLRAVIPQAYEPEEPHLAFERAGVAVPRSAALPGASSPYDPAGYDDTDYEAAEYETPGYAEAANKSPAEDIGAKEPIHAGLSKYDAEDDDEFADTGFAASDEDREDADGDGLYDCLASARELAQSARSSEDRGRKALYQAVARAYDFSLEAAANPEDFDDLLAENGLIRQDRAPMTPVVKLVFGADYDKTRLTEYAAVLGYAHRTGVARGTLASVLGQAEGGLKGVVQAERRARKEAAGKTAENADGIRPALAAKLRKRDAVALESLPGEGAEFALVMVRRTPDGTLEVIGEVPDDVKLVERAARRLIA